MSTGTTRAVWWVLEMTGGEMSLEVRQKVCRAAAVSTSFRNFLDANHDDGAGAGIPSAAIEVCPFRDLPIGPSVCTVRILGHTYDYARLCIGLHSKQESFILSLHRFLFVLLLVFQVILHIS